MKNQYLRLIKEIEFELAELDKIVSESAKLSLRFNSNLPDALETRGLGAILHDFYNGIENICKRIANEIDGGLPKGEDWHWRVLESMTLDLPEVRPVLFSANTLKSLDEYRRFRHIFRHMYGSHLDWERIKPLFYKLSAVFEEVKNETVEFMVFLKVLSNL